MLLLACAPARTAAEACRRQAAAKQFGRNVQQRQNPAADALEDMRCDAIERDEESRPRVAAPVNRVVQSRERAAPTRAAPLGLGASLSETRAACEERGGSLNERGSLNDGTVFICSIGPRAVFSCTLDATGSVVRLSAPPLHSD